MLSEKIVGLKRAAEVAGVSHQAISQWIDKHGIGEKVEGKWLIDADRLKEIVDARTFLKLRQ